MTISLCMIVKNEEDHLPRCLASVADLIDEIIIVDTGSTDRTKEVATSFEARIFDFTWIDDFAAARNYAFSLATQEYLLWLDADDVLEGQNHELFATLKHTLPPNIDYVSMDYHLTWDEYGNVTSSVRRNRLIRRMRGFRWIGMVHEYLEVYGPGFTSDIAIAHRSLHHDSNRNLRIYEKRLANGETFTPRDQFYFANELKDHGRHQEAVDAYSAFLDGNLGWIEDNLTACGRMADCYYELNLTDQAIQATLRALLYTEPRPESCCRLGYFFLQKKDYRSAAYWYRQALREDQQAAIWLGFNQACSTWLPHLQLCICYDRLGQHQLAYEHNERALSWRPNDAYILRNKKYFESILAL